MFFFVRKRHHANYRTLPNVVMVHFRDSHVEFLAQLVLETAQDLTFIFQRLRIRYVQLQRKQTDWHWIFRGRKAAYFLPADAPPCAAASAAESFCTLKHSRISPTFTSLKLAILRRIQSRCAPRLRRL